MTTIFGDTSRGVPNPVVPHAHPYPTRFHGQNLIQPQATFSYRETPYDVPRSAEIVRQMNGSPDGIGAEQQSGSYLQATLSGAWLTAYKVLSLVGAGTGAYHGYKRNDSVGWAIGWFLLGGLFPVVTIPVSLAQGYGKPHSRRVDI